MNIVFLTKTTLAQGVGGVEVHVESLLQGCRGREVNLTVLTGAHSDGRREEIRAGRRVIYLDGTTPGRYDRHFFQKSVTWLNRLAAENPIDLIWAEDFAAFGYLRQTLADRPIPVLTIMQGADWPGLVKSEWGRVNHCREAAEFFLKSFPEALFFYRHWYAVCLSRSDHVVAVSCACQKQYARRKGLGPERLSVIYNAADLSRFRPDPKLRRAFRSKWGIADDARVILMAAVLHKQKGLHVGFQGLAPLVKNDVVVVVVGDGPHRIYYEQQAKRWGVPANFCGALVPDDMAAAYNAADLFLNPTLRWEGMPLVTVEAMASGLPVVLTPRGGNQEAIDSGVEGFFVPAGNPQAITTSCGKLLTDVPLRQAMGRRARKRAETQFALERMVDAYLTVSQELTERRPVSREHRRS